MPTIITRNYSTKSITDYFGHLIKIATTIIMIITIIRDSLSGSLTYLLKGLLMI
jgi:hypothetical protein